MNYLQNLFTTSTRPGVERPGEGEEASDELLTLDERNGGRHQWKGNPEMTIALGTDDLQ